MNDQDILEWWNERAAIKEHHGGITRLKAEHEAAKETRDQVGYLPEVVLEAVRKSRNEANQTQSLFE